jgi:hypothetical protein
MYLFTRAGRFGPGSVGEGMTFVTSITEKVHQDTGLEMHSWAATMSPELGTVVWATFVETLEELEAAQDKLAVSDSFIAMAESGSHLFVGPLEDAIAQVVTGEMDPTAPLPSYVTVARAVAVNGRLGDAMAAGVEIAEAATRIGGAATGFLVDATGPYGGCRWNTGFPDIGSLERAEAALMADPSWLQLIDRVGDCYQAGVTQSIYRRII